MKLIKMMPNMIGLELPIGNVYFSYETPIAFEHKGNLVISENVWSNTTGKHLNEICTDKSIRIKNSEFEKKLSEFYLCILYS